MDKPVRVQLSRKKGWRMPPNTVKVSRRGQYGNPFEVGGYYMRGGSIGGMACTYIQAAEGFQDVRYKLIRDRAEAVKWFRWYLTTYSENRIATLKASLHGRNLACWCPLNEPCHADVLLELANAPVARLRAAKSGGE